MYPHLLSGVKVVDISKVLSGPFAARILADHGAEVLKIESANHHDDSRYFSPLIRQWSGYYEQYNHNKKGINLDLSQSNGYSEFIQLIREADVLVENLTNRVTSKLKIDYETLRQINPQLIYASITGEHDNPHRKYYDVIAQAESGLMSLSGELGKPAKIGPAAVDAMSGMSLAFGIAAALYWRTNTHHGQHLQVSLLGAALQLTEANIIEYSVNHTLPNPPGNHDTAIAPFGIYATKDGHIAIACGNDRLWNKLVEQIGEPNNPLLFESNEKRLLNQADLIRYLESAFSAYLTEDLYKALTECGVPSSPVRSIAEISQKNISEMLTCQNSQAGMVVMPSNPVFSSSCSTVEYTPAPELTT